MKIWRNKYNPIKVYKYQWNLIIIIYRSNSPPQRHKLSDSSDNSYDAGEIRITQVNVIERVNQSLENCFKTDEDFDSDLSPVLPVKIAKNQNELLSADDSDKMNTNSNHKVK